MIIFLLFGMIDWQIANIPLDDSLQTISAYLTIGERDLKWIKEDSLYFATYEIQLIINDKNGNQLMGDFWRRKIGRDTICSDSCEIIAPKRSDHLILKLLDLNDGEILNIREEIKKIKNLGNIRWQISNDTLQLRFSIFNKKGKINQVTVLLKDMKKDIPVVNSNYDTLVFFDVQKLPIGEYQVEFIGSTNEKKIDKVVMPIHISRPFWLDDNTWKLKVTQLEYIGTAKEINKLKEAAFKERDSLWYEFWHQYDPTPNTEYNEKEAEYFSRIEYCEENFSHGDKGWRSDRARIYVKYGPPDEIQSRPCEISTYPYEVWLYYRLNRKFYFVDRYGFGEYMLINYEGGI